MAALLLLLSYPAQGRGPGAYSLSNFTISVFTTLNAQTNLPSLYYILSVLTQYKNETTLFYVGLGWDWIRSKWDLRFELISWTWMAWLGMVEMSDQTASIKFPGKSYRHLCFLSYLILACVV